jgi:tungstate transport system substrate-binding protein
MSWHEGALLEFRPDCTGRTVKRLVHRLVLTLFLASALARADEGILRLATTTSTVDSGLLSVIVPRFESFSGLKVVVASAGSGAAMKLAEGGKADVVLVHSRADEDRFVQAGFGVDRRDVMYNDFVIVGPTRDPAQVKKARGMKDALRRIVESGETFVSRGDESGTHEKEKACWREAGREPTPRQYVSTGQGMGEVLTTASNLRGYTLSDRATYSAYRTRLDLDVLVEGDPMLFNPYGVIAVNSARHPQVNYKGAKQFIDWITGPEGRRAIAEFRVNGQQLFYPTP